MSQKLLTTFLMAGLALPVIAQSGGGSAQTPGPPSNRNPESTSGMGKYANMDQLMGHQHGSLYFRGKVVMDGGQLPWDPVRIVVACNGTTRFDTQTDPRGGFQIESAPTNSEVSKDPSAPKHLPPSQLVGCDVHADLLGFQSSKITILNNSIMDNPDIGTISLHQDEHATGSVVSPTTASAPQDALKFFDKARSDALANRADSAEHNLEKAVKADPQFAEAWYQLGKLQEKDKPQEAWNSYTKATVADAQFAPPYERMAVVAAQQKKWQDMLDATNHYLKLNPAGTPLVWYLNASANYNLGHKEVGETSATTALAMDPNHDVPNTEQLLAVILAGRGDFAGALQHLRNALTYTPPGPNSDMIKQQVAQLERVVK
jgi:tetratricopeptide (TPR) repeat protein